VEWLPNLAVNLPENKSMVSGTLVSSYMEKNSTMEAVFHGTCPK
jgi:hypothetical protein